VASWPITNGSFAMPSGVRGGNSSKEKLSGEACTGSPKKNLKMLEAVS
jgi:hypothetical protein